MRARPAAARGNAGDLLFRLAVNNKHGVKLRAPARAGFHEQGDVKNKQAAALLLRRLRPAQAFLHDEGVNDGFKALARAGVGAHECAHGGAVKRAGGIKHMLTKRFMNGWQRRAACARDGA